MPTFKVLDSCMFFGMGEAIGISNFVPINKLFADTVFASGSKLKKKSIPNLLSLTHLCYIVGAASHFCCFSVWLRADVDKAGS